VSILLALHVFANTVWIGAIAAVGLLTVAAASGPASLSTGQALAPAQAAPVAAAAVGLYRKLATPAFAVSFLTGVGRLLGDPGAYMSLHWFHGKLTGAVVVIALHHVLGARARKVAEGSRQVGRSSAILTGATLACAFVTVTFAVLKGTLVP
jgi:protoporphyrinogen IX oxidase